MVKRLSLLFRSFGLGHPCQSEVDEPGQARSNLLRPSLILIQKLTLSRQVQFGIPPKVCRLGKENMANKHRKQCLHETWDGPSCFARLAIRLLFSAQPHFNPTSSCIQNRAVRDSGQVFCTLGLI